ncbi:MULTISPECIES: alpha-mannosidase [Limnospira]|uniref:alpha-mannosidase n=1 Tax=Limnospira TaxID=2596745 RepID=UPI0001E2ACF2|nr:MULTISPECIES: alpha-mannosidase [unclassified Limnospira]EKD06217.1 glycoside hydrolase family 38 [Arthrospira platensis C1]MDY7054899.1 alpha-mannosidase [Limnospira fusiformis LS22]QJB26755.1 alpha-mannosidase [Limnospira fusiformis SAG 85.79]MDT9189430.1 alpha-mannosidase [Limnospira sp. PMC 894.15]MDT9235284.1 alpha-mannosidase [Limnospira sp. PMC 917.15]
MSLSSSDDSRVVINQAIARLREMTRSDLQRRWRFHEGDISPQMNQGWRDWSFVDLNDRGHVAWSEGGKVLWLAQEVNIPANLGGYRLEGLCLKLSLVWWAQLAEVYVNGSLVQSGDLFDCRTAIVLSESVLPSTKFRIFLRLVSPPHDRGALVASSCVYQAGKVGDIDPGFIGDELAVYSSYLLKGNIDELELTSRAQVFPLLSPQRWQELGEAVSRINWDIVGDRHLFMSELFRLRECWDTCADLKLVKFRFLGHAHLDLAWLWSVAETWSVAIKTFESVLALQDDFPELIFTHSTPALYAWLEENRPDLFKLIQNRISQKRWEVAAGLWVEPELNTVSGESIVRQILYGQYYVADQFGEVSRIAWLPDSFGFSWQLPQLLTLGRIDFFATQKLRWNDTTVFPYGCFRWRGLNGTEIVSLMSAPIGENVEPLKLVNYGIEWESQTGLNECLWLPGVGDHGGGPTREMLEVIRRWRSSPLFPDLRFMSAVDYLDGLGDLPNLPVWNDELYLEFHRGCYTTHADQKRWNRLCEGLLYRAELWSAVASIVTGFEVPQATLEEAWKGVLFNQFHDILPGSAIAEVYEDANRGWQAAATTAGDAENRALDAIASSISLPYPPQPQAIPIVVFNPLNWTRSEIVQVPLPPQGSWDVCESTGNALNSQLVRVSGRSELLFFATDVPSVGYRCFWLVPKSPETPMNQGFEPKNDLICAHLFRLYYTISGSRLDVNTNRKNSENWEFENQYLRVKVSGETGDLIEIFDKVNSREVLTYPGHQWRLFRDQGQYWDAWNIDPNYHKYPLDSPQLESIEFVEKGYLRGRLRVFKRFNNSRFCQDYVLSIGSPILRVECRVEWRENHVLMKGYFPLSINADLLSYEIPCGVMERKTEPQTNFDKSKWEVPALNWGSLSDGNYGVSLLNDCKYGYDFKPDEIGLSLLRGSLWPDPKADVGVHEFSYGIYPHLGDWRQGETVRRGYEFNQPLQVRVLELSNVGITGGESCRSFLGFSASNFVLMAVKRSHLDHQTWIIRGYECQGSGGVLEFENSLGVQVNYAVNLLEERVGVFDRKMQPWQVLGLAISGKTGSDEVT